MSNTLFLKQFWSRYRTTGAIWPSGRRLSRALARYVREPSDSPRRILEVGPGTGPVTAEIVTSLRTKDQLELVELNDAFVEHLRSRFATEPKFQAVAERAKIHHLPVEQLPEEHAYDLIVSGLPLNNFEVAEVDAILKAFRKLAKPGCILSFFEYVAIRKVKAVVSGPKTRTRLRGIATSLEALFENEVHRDCILLNVTPAWVHHVRL